MKKKKERKKERKKEQKILKKSLRNGNPCHSLFSEGIICGPHRGSSAVRDHLRSNLGIISGQGIICGRGSFAALYSFFLFKTDFYNDGSFTAFTKRGVFVRVEVKKLFSASEEKK